jgi:hypothetical protein
LANGNVENWESARGKTKNKAQPNESIQLELFAKKTDVLY